MSRILVTGGAGYLGGRIVSYLRVIGYEVVCGTRSQEHGERSGWRHTDFNNPSSLARAFEGCSTIVHLAGMNEVEAARNPEAALHETATYTLRAVQAATQALVSRFIYFSTVHVYGSPLSGFLSEDSPTRAAHPYSIAHRAAEDFVHLAHREGTISATIFRLSNGYGYPERPGVDRWTLLVNDLCRQVTTTGIMTLKSSGIQLRDFIPLCDVCTAVAHFIDAPRQTDPVFNLGSGQSVTVLQVARRIAERYETLTGNTAKMDIPPPKPGEEPLPFLLSVEKLAATGLSPRGLLNDEIDESLRRCMAWRIEGLL